MGLSTKEFDALANGTSRYFIRRPDDGHDAVWGGWQLVDRTTSETVWSDQMEPEDAILPRDLYGLVVLLNKHAADEADAVASAVKATWEEAVKACEDAKAGIPLDLSQRDQLIERNGAELMIVALRTAATEAARRLDGVK